MNQADDKLWSLAGEAGVLGSVIVDPGIIPQVLAILPDETAFYLPEHRKIFVVIVELYKEGNPVDGLTVRVGLKDRNQLDEIGGLEYLQKVLDSVPSAANAEYYALIVKRRWQYRQAVHAVENMQKVLDEPLAVDEQMEQVRQLAMDLSTKHQQNGCYTLKDTAKIVAASIAETESSIPTGYRSIDRIIGGVRENELAILAGRPSMGKSALSGGMALTAAKDGRSVLYVSLEMGHRSLIERAIGMVGGMNVAAVKRFPQTDAVYERAKEAAHVLSKYDLTIHEGLNTPEKLVSFVAEQKKMRRFDIVFVDYLQLMSAKGRIENRVAEISAISRRLKGLAMDESIPVVALSQLNRECESRVGHRPRLSDLRESGSIEQDADIVLLLHREDYYRQIESPSDAKIDGVAEIIVAKNRRGATGTAKLVFLPEVVKFGDLSEGQDDE